MMNTEKEKRELNIIMERSSKMTAGEFEKIVDQIKKNFSDINEKILNIGKCYLKCFAAGEEYVEKLKEAFPDIPNSKWGLFGLVGMNKIAPGLVVYGGTGFNLIKRLPVSEQERLLTKSIEVLTIDKNGKTDIIKAEFKTLSYEQQKQVISFDHIRNLSEQRTHIETIHTRQYLKTPINKNENYIRKNGNIKFTTEKWFTEAEVMQLALEIVGRKK